jgi:hypothetical protein
VAEAVQWTAVWEWVPVLVETQVLGLEMEVVM